MSHTEKFQNFVDRMNTRNDVAFDGTLDSLYERLQMFGDNWFAQGLISESVSKTLRNLAGDLEGIRYIRDLDSRKAEFEKWLVQLNAVVLVEQPAEEAKKAEAAAEEIEMSAKYVRMDDGTFGVPAMDGNTYPVAEWNQMVAVAETKPELIQKYRAAHREISHFLAFAELALVNECPSNFIHVLPLNTTFEDVVGRWNEVVQPEFERAEKAFRNLLQTRLKLWHGEYTEAEYSAILDDIIASVQ